VNGINTRTYTRTSFPGGGLISLPTRSLLYVNFLWNGSRLMGDKWYQGEGGLFR